MTVSGFRVVVATHRRPQWLAELLASLVPQIADRPGRELVVVNDGSHDDAYEAAIAPFAADIDYRVLPTPRGPGAARQHGTEGAAAEYLVFTDDDCVAPAYWLDWAEALAEMFSTVDLFGGYTRPHRDEKAGALMRMNKPFVPCPTPLFVEDEVVCVSTSCMMVRRHVFEEIGGFLAAYGAASEDWNLTRRLLWAGCEAHLDPTWYLYHRPEQTLGQTLRRWRGYGRGLAQQAIHDQDWSAVAMRRMRILPPPRPRTGLVERMAYRVIYTVARIEHRLGWWEGKRIYSARFGRGLPPEPTPAQWCAPFVLAGRGAASGGDVLETLPGEVSDRVGGQA